MMFGERPVFAKKLCDCGCGTEIAAITRGVPRRFAPGHYGRVQSTATTWSRWCERVAKLPNGCWEWTGFRDDKGYGRTRVSGRRELAHRVGYVMLVGPIPDGLELDHLCRNRACVNPAHLEPVTHRENVLRGALAEVQRRRMLSTETCAKGHPLTEDNVYHPPATPTWRHCRTCAAERREAARLAKEAQRV